LQMRLAEHEVSYGHWPFLRALWAKDGLTQQELSEIAGVMPSTTTAALKAMEALGYIERRQRVDNRKFVEVYLTDKGRDLERKLIPLAEEVSAISMAGLTDHEIKNFRKMLLTISDNLAKDEIASANLNLRVPSTREMGRLISDRHSKDTVLICTES